MQKIPIVVAGLLLFIISASAQTQKIYSVKSGEVPDHVIPFEVRYAFPAFSTGSAFLRNGSVSEMRFNYNILLDEMQFLTNANDTLAIAAPEELKYVSIDSSIFYYDKGYLKQVIKAGDFVLAVRRGLTVISDGKESGYNGYSNTGSITTYNRIVSGNRAYALEVKRDALFSPFVEYFLGDQYNHFEKANRKSFLSVFSDKKKDIQHYLKVNKVNFNDEADLVRLLKYCTE